MKAKFVRRFYYYGLVLFFAAATGTVFAQPVILTPPAPDKPRINGPDIFGVRPGSPLLYTIPATGKRPMTFSATNLPSGLKLDQTTRRISGSLQSEIQLDKICCCTGENAIKWSKGDSDNGVFTGSEIINTPNPM